MSGTGLVPFSSIGIGEQFIFDGEAYVKIDPDHGRCIGDDSIYRFLADLFVERK